MTTMGNVKRHVKSCHDFCTFGQILHLIRPSICILELDVGLLPDAVQVLMKAV